MGYSFVTAAVNSMTKYGLGIYVKYTRSTQDKIIIKEDNFKYTWIVCPDRELVLVKNNLPLFAPMGENFDEYVDMNIFDDNVCNELELDVYMINYSAYGVNSKASPRGRRNGRNPNAKQPHIIADSGGFQLYSGTKEYIDPNDVIAWYNENVDWAMSLDVPPFAQVRGQLQRSAKIQAANNQIMMDNKREDLELINVVQGTNHADRMEFLNIIDRPDINRIAFPAYRDSPIADVASILRIVNAKRKFKHYHVLGVYNLLKLTAIIKLANMKGAPFITSDASTPIQSAVNKIYHHQQSIFEPERRLIIGNREVIPSVHNFLPCSCPVCHTIKYVSILGALDSQLTSNLLSIHNMWEVNRYTNMMSELARNLDNRDYKSVVRHQLKSRAADTLIALDLVDNYAKDPDYALKKYAIYFSNNSGGLLANTGLFPRDSEDSSEIDKNLFINSKTNKETDAEKSARLEKMFARYEKFHGIKNKSKDAEKPLSKKDLASKKKKRPTEISLSTKSKKK